MGPMVPTGSKEVGLVWSIILNPPCKEGPVIEAPRMKIVFCLTMEMKNHILYRFVWGCVFHKCISPEGLAKEPPKMGLPGG